MTHLNNYDKERFLDNVRHIFKSKITLIVCFFVIAVLLLTNSFYNNSFDAADMTKFRYWEKSSESLVIGRLIKSQQEGLRSDYGLLQSDNNWEQANNFITGDHVDSFFIYPAQVGLQGFIFGLVDRLITLNNNETLELLYLINSILLAVLIALVAVWAIKQFNWISGIFVIAGCVFSQWLVFSARNLYWVTWTMLLPFVIILYMHWIEKKGVRMSQWFYFLVAFITIFIRAACGFEFISSILISIELPVIYYAIIGKWDKKRYITRSVCIGMGGILAFISTICVNLWQRTMYFGNFNMALNDFIGNVSKRTGAFDVEIPAVYQDSLEQPLLGIINTYLRAGDPLVLDYRMNEIILFLIMSTVVLFISKKYIHTIEENRSKLASFCIVVFISLSGTLSWIILAKGHSFIHYHINYILWFFPSLLLIFAFCGAVFSVMLKAIWEKHHHMLKRCAIVLSMFLLFSWPVYRYYRGWNWRQNNQLVQQAKSSGVTIYNDESFEVYYYNNELIYKVSKEANVFERFFLHITPVNMEELPQDQLESGFENHDFDFIYSKIDLPFWEKAYVAKVSLPNYEIASIATGQYNSSMRIWEASVDLTN